MAGERDLIEADEPVSSCLPSLDHILAGGFAANRIHLIEGAPGAGKTTLGMQFLMEGRREGEKGLYITLSESKEELLHVARTHKWDLEGIEIFELVPPELSLDEDREQSIVYASDLELGETVKMVKDEVERIGPTRVVFDSLSEIRLLAQGALRFRRQVLALKHFFAQHGCTVLFLDDLTELIDDLSLHSLAHGVVRLEQIAMTYGAERRRLRVHKMRGRKFQGGYHDFTIRQGGLEIFPRLVASDHPDVSNEWKQGKSGVPGLDDILGGGLDYGTSTLLIGPSGTGKSTIGLRYAYEAMSAGEKALIISFDETVAVFDRRASGLGMDTSEFKKDGRLTFRQVDPAELSPGELTGIIREQVEEEGVCVVVLDSLSGYQQAMPEEQFLMLQMHEILTYLNQQHVLTILILTQAGMIGQMQSPLDLTYLSDTVLLLRYFEADSEIRRAVSVIKKRTGRHEPSIREFRIGDGGLHVGPRLDGFHGVLTGTPVYQGREELMRSEASR